MISWEWWNLHSGVWTRDPICYNTVNLKRIPGLQVAQMAKCPPTMWETQVRSLGREDPWRRKWQPTPVFLPGKSHRQRSLIGYSPWGRKESDTTEWLHFTSLHVPYIPGSYAILFFTALDFTSITSHIHNWVLFLLWFHLFILSGVSLLISSSILGTYRPEEFLFQ